MTATLTVDLDVIEQNARSICSRLAEIEVAVAGVTKAVCGDEYVAGAMLAGGCSQVADSRLPNLGRLRRCEQEIRAKPFERWLLRAPTPDEADAAVGVADVSMVTEFDTVAALSRAAREAQRPHQVVLMVELGDLREGLMPDEVLGIARSVAQAPYLVLGGIGANLTCFGGVIPGADNLARLVEVATHVERVLDLELAWISGGATSSLRLAFAGELPARINHLRIGEGILLGKDTIDRSDLVGTRQDAFSLSAPVIEVSMKPSAPWGTIGQDSWGRVPRFEDQGIRRRACVAIGRQDIGGGTLAALDGGVKVLGASADILVADVTEAGSKARVGSELTFRPDYAALSALSVSPFVEKRRKGPHRPAGTA